MYHQYQFSFLSKYSFLFIIFLLISFSCKKSKTIKVIELENGLKIRESVTVIPNVYQMNADRNLKESVIKIEGKNLIVDFQGAILQGSNDKEFPDEYYGVGIEVRGENIEIKNLIVKGYGIGLKVDESKNIKIDSSNFSFMTKYKLDSKGEQPRSEARRIVINQESFGIGSGIYLKDSKNISISNSKIFQNDNGIEIEIAMVRKFTTMKLHIILDME